MQKSFLKRKGSKVIRGSIITIFSLVTLLVFLSVNVMASIQTFNFNTDLSSWSLTPGVNNTITNPSVTNYGKVMKIYDNGTASANAIYTLPTALTGIVVVECDIMYEIFSAWAAPNLLDSSGATALQLGYVGLSSLNQLVYKNYPADPTGVAFSPSIVPVLGQWFRLKIVFNTNTCKFDMYHNGTLVGSDLTSTYGPGVTNKNIKTIKFLTSGGSKGTMNVDNIVISNNEGYIRKDINSDVVVGSTTTNNTTTISSGKYNFNGYINNATASGISNTLILAVYQNVDGSSVLKDVKYVNNTITANSVKQLVTDNVTVPNDGGSYYIKAFRWLNFDTIQPVENNWTFDGSGIR